MISAISVFLQKGGVPSDHYPSNLTIQGHLPTVHDPTPPVQDPQSLFWACLWGMFKLVELGPHCTCTPSPRPFLKLVHYEAHTVGKLAVGILLECFLVLTMIIVKNDEVTMKINKFNIETRVDLETNQMIQRSRDGRTSTTGRSWIICTCIILIDVKYPDLALTKS